MIIVFLKPAAIGWLFVFLACFRHRKHRITMLTRVQTGVRMRKIKLIEI